MGHAGGRRGAADGSVIGGVRYRHTTPEMEARGRCDRSALGCRTRDCWLRGTSPLSFVLTHGEPAEVGTGDAIRLRRYRLSASIVKARTKDHAAMPPPRSTSNRRLVVGLLLVLAAIFALLTAAQGVAINMVSTLVDHTWVEDHRRLVFTVFGVLAAINLLLAVVIAWLTYRASQPDSLASDHSGPHAEIAGGHGGVAIGAIYGSGTPGSAGAPNRSVMVEGDMADSIVATGDNATIIILPTTQDQAPSTPRSRTDLLDELVVESHARTVARWQAAGLPSELARELAEDLSIGALPPQLAEFLPGCVRVLEGHLGIGKSLLGEQGSVKVS